MHIQFLRANLIFAFVWGHFRIKCTRKWAKLCRFGAFFLRTNHSCRKLLRIWHSTWSLFRFPLVWYFSRPGELFLNGSSEVLWALYFFRKIDYYSIVYETNQLKKCQIESDIWFLFFVVIISFFVILVLLLINNY